MEQIEALNRTLFLKINASPSVAAWIIDSAILIANDLIYLIPALLAAMWLWGDKAKRSLALKACLVAMIGVGLNQIIGLVWQHPRPFMIGLGHAWLPHASDSSFPSDHMTVFGSIGISLLFGGEAGLAAIALAAGLGVAWSRVFLGVHFPPDMVGAVLVSGITYAIVTPIWAKAGDRVMKIVVRCYRKIFAWPISSGWIRR